MSYEINASDLNEVVENLNKPLIPEGEFLAVVTDVSIHSKTTQPTKKSVKWELSINLSNPDDGWDDEGRRISLFPAYYTPLGEEVLDEDGNKALRLNKAGYGITIRTLKALNQPIDVVPPTDAVGRILRVVIAHEERVWNGETRYDTRIKTVRPYQSDPADNDTIAPKIDLGVDELDSSSETAF